MDKPDGVTKDQVLLELDRVLAGSQFRGSDRHRRFLQFIVEEAVEGRADSVKESVVAGAVFDRVSSFDSRTDSVVRVEARNLRRRLSDYYLSDGAADPLIIELPKGTYVPVFRPGTPPAVVSGPARRWSGGKLVVAAAVLLLPVCIGGWLASRLGPRTPASVAVLPFLTLNAGPDEQYFADGLVEDLTTELGSVKGLRVASRTSAFQFRGKNADVREIGRQLGVDAVLEGSVRREASHVKITAQLIGTRDGYHIWAHSYEADGAGLEEAKQQIWRAAASALGANQTAPASTHTPTPRAREALWRGRYLHRNWQAPEEALRYFEEAVRLDPQYAEAWAALATNYSGMVFQMVGSVPEAAAKTRDAAGRALSLDAGVAEAHLALASIDYSYSYDWPAGEREYRRALELNPNSAGAHRAYALALAAHGRFPEVTAQLKTAQELDPLSIVSTNNLAVSLYLEHRFEESAQVAKRHLEMEPQFFPAGVLLANNYAHQGKLSESLTEFGKALAVGRPVEFLGDLGYAMAQAGHAEDARRIEAEIAASPQGKTLAGVALGKIYTALGEADRAVEFLQGAATAHVANVVFIGVEPDFDPLRRHPAFRALCARLGLPNGAAAE